MEIYLDNSSTTKVCLPAAEKCDGMHDGCIRKSIFSTFNGLCCRKEMTKRASIAKTNWGKENEIFFTSGEPKQII